MYNIEKVIFALKDMVLSAIKKLVEQGALQGEINENFEIEIPADREHGDFSSNAAFVLAKNFKMPPKKIADLIVNFLCSDDDFQNKTSLKARSPGA